MKECLAEARRRRKAGTLALCPAGYCKAKEVYGGRWSAYASGYASRYCRKRGMAPPGSPRNLSRWFDEEWIDVCRSTWRPDGTVASVPTAVRARRPPVPMLPPLPAHQQSPRHGEEVAPATASRRSAGAAAPSAAPHRTYRPARSQSPARRRFSRRRSKGRRKP